MAQPTKTTGQFFLRTAAVLLHAVLNFIGVTWFMNFDLTGSWLLFVVFLIVVALLVYLFLRHLISFLHFVKNQ